MDLKGFGGLLLTFCPPELISIPNFKKDPFFIKNNRFVGQFPFANSIINSVFKTR